MNLTTDFNSVGILYKMPETDSDIEQSLYNVKKEQTRTGNNTVSVTSNIKFLISNKSLVQSLKKLDIVNTVSRHSTTWISCNLIDNSQETFQNFIVALDFLVSEQNSEI